MMRQKLIFVGLVVMLTACLKDQAATPLPIGPCVDTVQFNDELLVPLLNTSCNTSGCHSSGDAAAGYVLEGHDLISSNAEAIFEAISHDPGRTPMPLSGDKLADSLIQKFDCWIQQGKLNN
jgi:hypothetical protein